MVADQHLRQSLSHFLWIGGAADAGKTTLARIIAERHGLQRYDYDRRSMSYLERLAQTQHRYRDFLTATMDERWVRPKPEDLTPQVLQRARDQFPLVIEDLIALPKKPMIIAEGLGLLPELVSPVLTNKRQAVWLVPTEEFKQDSMRRRHKSLAVYKTSDPKRGMRNLFTLGLLLAEQVKAQAESRGLVVYEVDGARSVEEMASLIEQHFEPLLLGDI